MPNDGVESPPTVAFADIANLGWTAGAHYYRNLFVALHQLDGPRRPRVVVAVSALRGSAEYDTYAELADDVIVIPPLRRGGILLRQARRVRNRLGRGDERIPALEQLLRANGVDALFACWQEFGSSFAIPVLGWIPDFQHRHFPEVFSPEENHQRDDLFERMAVSCTRIVLSSDDARADFQRFHPKHADKARVLRFVAHVAPDVYDDDPGLMCTEYQLPERFFYLPNQFWVHKNHAVVVDALAILKSRRPEITVVCSGNPADNRDPLHFARLLARVSRLHVRDRFIVLGWIPHAHTYALMRQSLAVLQPSLFEGWSTTVEEAKSIGKSIVVSDIPVHREQAPLGGVFFDPTDPAALADRLIEVYDTRSPGPDVAMEARARAALPERTRAYAEVFMDVVRDAIGAREGSARGAGQGE